jgi:hypothetical protein
MVQVHSSRVVAIGDEEDGGANVPSSPTLLKTMLRWSKLDEKRAGSTGNLTLGQWHQWVAEVGRKRWWLKVNMCHQLGEKVRWVGYSIGC